MNRLRSSHRAFADEPVLRADVVREREHPADGRLGDRPIDGPGGDEQQHVRRGAGGDIDRVVADAEPADGEQVRGLSRGSRP